jgi:hypothetical protein
MAASGEVRDRLRGESHDRRHWAAAYGSAARNAVSSRRYFATRCVVAGKCPASGDADAPLAQELAEKGFGYGWVGFAFGLLHDLAFQEVDR